VCDEVDARLCLELLLGIRLEREMARWTASERNQKRERKDLDFDMLSYFLY